MNRSTIQRKSHTEEAARIRVSGTASGLAKLLCAAVVLTGCGGGGSDSTGAASTGSGTSGGTASALSAGPITGFGSVIVNGVRFDDSSASITDDSGAAHVSGDLRLGMMAEVDSDAVTSDSNGSHGKARAFRFGSEIVGPVSTVAADGTSLVVLGETVQITAATMFDDSLVGGVKAIVAGTTVVEVHAMRDVATGIYTATRIEPKTNAAAFKIRGVVSAIDKTAHTFKIGSGTDTISYDAIASAVPAAFDNGLLVRVLLKTAQASGAWVATAITSEVRKVEDHDEAELEGTIDTSTFATDKKFSINGISIDATNATFPNGTTGIVVGARVEVHGSAVGGVVVAARVSVEDEHQREQEGFELHGAISAFDSVAKTFLLRGVTVSFAAATVEFDDGAVANLVNGVQVEVKGMRSGTGTTLVATRIKFEK